MIPAFNPLALEPSGPRTVQVSGPGLVQLCQSDVSRIALYLFTEDNQSIIYYPTSNVQPGFALVAGGRPELTVISYITHPYLCSVEWYAYTGGPVNNVIVWEVYQR